MAAPIRAVSLISDESYALLTRLQAAQRRIASRSAAPGRDIEENSCCRCLRRGWEKYPDSCNALFDGDGHNLQKCDYCASLKQDCVSVWFTMRYLHVAYSQSLLILGILDSASRPGGNCRQPRSSHPFAPLSHGAPGSGRWRQRLYAFCTCRYHVQEFRHGANEAPTRAGPFWGA